MEGSSCASVVVDLLQETLRKANLIEMVISDEIFERRFERIQQAAGFGWYGTPGPRRWRAEILGRLEIRLREKFCRRISRVRYLRRQAAFARGSVRGQLTADGREMDGQENFSALLVGEQKDYTGRRAWMPPFAGRRRKARTWRLDKSERSHRHRE